MVGDDTAITEVLNRLRWLRDNSAGVISMIEQAGVQGRRHPVGGGIRRHWTAPASRSWRPVCGSAYSATPPRAGPDDRGRTGETLPVAGLRIADEQIRHGPNSVVAERLRRRGIRTGAGRLRRRNGRSGTGRIRSTTTRFVSPTIAPSSSSTTVAGSLAVRPSPPPFLEPARHPANLERCQRLRTAHPATSDRHHGAVGRCAARTDVSWQDPTTVVARIGEPAHTLSPGAHVVTIRYTIAGVLDPGGTGRA